MSFIKYWSIIISLSAVICVLVELIMPPGKMEKMIKMILNIFILSISITSFKGLSKNFKFNINNIKDDTVIKKSQTLLKDVNNQLEETVKDNIKSIIYKSLKSENIYPQKIKIIMDINEDKSISITKSQIYVKQSQYYELKDKIKNYIQDNFKIDTEVLIFKD